MKMVVCSLCAHFVSFVSLWFILFYHKGTKNAKILRGETTHLSLSAVYEQWQESTKKDLLSGT